MRIRFVCLFVLAVAAAPFASATELEGAGLTGISLTCDGAVGPTTCEVAQLPLGTATWDWSFARPVGVGWGGSHGCQTNDAACAFVCSRIATVTVTVTARNASNAVIGTASTQTLCGPVDG